MFAVKNDLGHKR